MKYTWDRYKNLPTELNNRHLSERQVAILLSLVTDALPKWRWDVEDPLVWDEAEQELIEILTRLCEEKPMEYGIFEMLNFSIEEDEKRLQVFDTDIVGDSIAITPDWNINLKEGVYLLTMNYSLDYVTHDFFDDWVFRVQGLVVGRHRGTGQFDGNWRAHAESASIPLRIYNQTDLEIFYKHIRAPRGKTVNNGAINENIILVQKLNV